MTKIPMLGAEEQADLTSETAKQNFLAGLPMGDTQDRTPSHTPKPKFVKPRRRVEGFIAAWTELGGTAERLAPNEAADAVGAYAKGRGTVLAAKDAVEGLVPELIWPDCGLEAAASAAVGVVRAEGAAAQTGSVIVRSDTNGGRAVSLLPPSCVFVVREEDIMATLGDFLRGLTTLPSQFVAVTGPSRSADIESTLVIGVHGPGEVHALLIS